MAKNIIPFPRKSSNDNGDNLPPQPGLRSFIVYDSVPSACIAHPADDEEVAPHIFGGEFAVIDPTDRDPVEGELFLVQWQSGRRSLVELRLKWGRYHTGPNGEAVEAFRWIALMNQRTRSPSGHERRLTQWFDGPYREEHMREKIVGKVVGIYQPDFREQLRPLAA